MKLFLDCNMDLVMVEKKKHDLYGGEDFIERVCKSLREYSMKIIEFEKKKMMSSTNELEESCKICYICKKKKRCLNIITLMIKLS